MNYTYGAELEIPDWNCKTKTQELEKTGAKRNLDDTTIINSSGVSNDPSLQTCIYGSEINTMPTDSITSQISHISDVLNSIGDYGVNHSQNLHLHIRVPGLRDNIQLLKQFTLWIYENQEAYSKRFIYPELERQSNLGVIESDEHSQLRRKFHARRKQSRMRYLYPYEIEAVKKAQNYKEWYDSHFAYGKVMQRKLNYTLHRQYINLPQLNATDTIEFRFFSFEDSLEKIRNAFELCEATVAAMISNKPLSWIPDFDLPRGEIFNPWLEKYGQISKVKKEGTKKDFEKHIEYLKYLLRDGIITENDLGVDLYELRPGPVPEGDLEIVKEKCRVGTKESREKWLKKLGITDEEATAIQAGNANAPEIW